MALTKTLCDVDVTEGRVVFELRTAMLTLGVPYSSVFPTFTSSWRSVATHRSGADTLRFRRSDQPKHLLGSG